MHVTAPASYFWFFAFAAIPVIIYLIFRRRRKDVPWGAIYILKRLLENKSKVSAWKQYFIIALRTLALAALAFAFLRAHRRWSPPAGGAFPAPPSSTHRVILLDVSESMEAAYGSGACLDAALSLCRKALAAGRFPSRLDILPLDGRDEPFVFEPLPAAPAEVEAFMAAVRRQGQALELERGLRRALSAFRASHYRNKELFVLSDLSARDFQPVERYAAVLRALRRNGVAIRTLSFENRDARNFAVRQFSPGMDLLLAGQPTLFYLRAGYYGAAPSAETWLTVRDDKGDVLHEQALHLAQGEKLLELPLTLAAGEQSLTAAVADDDFPADNEAMRSFRVADRLRVVVVQDINLDTGFGNPREWLKTALGEGSGGARPVSEQLASKIEHGRALQAAIGRTPVAEESDPGREDTDSARYTWALEFINSAQVSPDVLVDRDGVILLDVDTLGENEVEALRAYAVRGGTVLLAPGPNAAPERFNAAFAAISPLPLEPPAVDEIDPDRYESAVLEKGDDRILRELESPRHGNIGNPRFYNHYRTGPAPANAAVETLFTLSDGSPLLVSRRLGRGQCHLWTAGLGMAWHSLTVHPAYPVLMSRLFNMAADARVHDLNLEPGQPIIREMEAPAVLVTPPDGKARQVETTVAAGRRFLRYDDTEAPGMYLVRPQPDDPTVAFRYHVSGTRAESDYRPLEGDERDAYAQAAGGAAAVGETEFLRAVGRNYMGRGLMPFACAALLALLLAEAGLARRWFS